MESMPIICPKCDSVCQLVAITSTFWKRKTIAKIDVCSSIYISTQSPKLNITPVYYLAVSLSMQIPSLGQ